MKQVYEDNYRVKRREELLCDIMQAKSEMEVAQKNFDCVYKEDEVDVCIYRYRAAQSRYGALLKRLKDLT